jgi:hypothetical protein
MKDTTKMLEEVNDLRDSVLNKIIDHDNADQLVSRLVTINGTTIKEGN